MSDFEGRSKTLNIAAWALSLVVIAVGVGMYLYTDRGLFLVFAALGVLTVLNVAVYDRLILKPQLRARAAQRDGVQPDTSNPNAREETPK